MNIAQLVAPLLETYPGISLDPTLLEVPQDRTLGDVAFPCFQYARELRKSPQQIAQDIAESLKPTKTIEKIVATGPYVNFFVSSSYLAKYTLEEISDKQEAYGKGEKIGESILVESPGPNTNKPLHLGHVRNMLLANALGNILKFVGHDVHAIDIVNDRGVHICKSMLAYQRLGNNEQPTMKPDHYVGKRYVEFSKQSKLDESRNDDIQTMLQKREAGDKDTVELWDRMRQRCITGQQETYARYGATIEKAYYESDHYLKGKQIVEDGVTTGLFTKNEKGHQVYTDEKLGEKVVLRSDGTAIYITQDIALGKLRYDDRSMDRMIYVVGSEQEHHFKFLFSIFKALGLPFADKCFHLSYGMVALPDGKMKSREGTVVDADPLADETHQASYEMLKARYPETGEEELHQKAEIIAMGAIKFFFLKYDAVKDFVYDKESSLRFDGETGPYIQYTYARCRSILAKRVSSDAVDYSLLSTQQERQILLLLNDFPEIVNQAAERYQPYLVARHLLELVSAFNHYYQTSKFLLDDDQPLTDARCTLVSAVSVVIKSGLNLLGIEVLEEM